MQTIKQLFNRDSLFKIILLLTLVLFAYLASSILNLILLTFMITYLVNSLQSMLVNQINKVIKVNPTIITIIIYMFITVTIVILAVKYIPIAISESILILNKMEYLKFSVVPLGLTGGQTDSLHHHDGFADKYKESGIASSDDTLAADWQPSVL